MHVHHWHMESFAANSSSRVRSLWPDTGSPAKYQLPISTYGNTLIAPAPYVIKLERVVQAVGLLPKSHF